jgi:exopolysaccharide biosynthesis WecB/TagA/CpsF family protein
MKSIELLNLRIDCLKADEFRELLKESYQGSNKIKVGKINTEFLLRAINSKEFEETINKFDVNIADGAGVLWAAKYMSLPVTNVYILRQIQAVWQMIYTGASLVFKPGYTTDPIPERFPGVEAMYLMLGIAEGNQTPVYLLGAEKKVSDIVPGRLKQRFPKLVIAGHHAGYDFDNEAVIKEINESKAGLVIVAFGSPKQEYWIRDNIDKLINIKVAVGEGGSFDFIAGENKRAPEWMKRAGLEWFWRMFMNTNKTGEINSRAKRRYGRVWQAVPVFIYTVVRYKIRSTENENGKG